jgi:hypothetical protein
MNAKFILLTPVYKDWKNLEKLLAKINVLFLKKLKSNFDLIIIDDCSNEKVNLRKFKFSKINKINVIKLNNNLGSQRAIAMGLKYVQKFYLKNYKLIIMDSDGQDNPNGILKMITKSKDFDSSVVARRGQRKEDLWFKMFYEVYCFFIFFFTFKKLRYGNFCVLKNTDVQKILKDKNLWSAFPPTLSINIKNIRSVTINREKRFSGNSKVNFGGLFFHALKVFSVLRYRIIFTSLLYLLISYFTLFNNFFLFLMIIIIPIFVLNLSNFTMSFYNKDNLIKNFKKIKVIKF